MRRLALLFLAVSVSCAYAAPPPSEMAIAAADAVDAKGRRPVIEPLRRDREIELLTAELNRLRVKAEMCEDVAAKKLAEVAPNTGR